jgi:hypothetical protein
MIVHQHVGVDPDPEALSSLPEQLQAMRPVGVIPVNRFLLIAAGGDVIAAAGPFDA